MSKQRWLVSCSKDTSKWIRKKAGLPVSPFGNQFFNRVQHVGIFFRSFRRAQFNLQHSQSIQQKLNRSLHQYIISLRGHATTNVRCTSRENNLDKQHPTKQQPTYVFFWISISTPTSGVTAAVIQPNSRLASTKSAKRESPIYKTFDEARDRAPSAMFLFGSLSPEAASLQSINRVSSRRHPSVYTSPGSNFSTFLNLMRLFSLLTSRKGRRFSV